MKDLQKSDVGKRFTAVIQSVPVEGRIQFERSRFYLCQNKRDGCNCSDKLGYKYSWVVSDGTIALLQHHGVSNLVVLPDVLQKGDRVYVSDESEEHALESKEERIFVLDAGEEYPRRYLVADCDLYAEKSKDMDLMSWKYAVPVPEKRFEDITIKLNDEYEAVVSEEDVTVGCQSFSFKKVEELYQAVKKAKEFKNL